MAKEQDTHTQNLFALAMHGQSQYTPKSEHLSYINPNAPKGGSIKVAAIGTFDTLNPYSLKGQSPQNMNLIYDRLMRRVWDEPFTMVPLIAQSIDVPDDRSSITFHLNPKAKFHDKSPITAQDIRFSFETLKEHGRPNMRRIYNLVDKIETPNKSTIHFTLKEGYNRETIMIIALMPVLSKSWWEGRNFDATLLESPLTNGPYRIKESNTGHRITYERIPDYWAKDLLANKGQYNVNTITYEYFRDDTIALEAFKKGDLDLRREWDVGKWESAYNNMNADIIRREAPHKRPERAHGFILNLRHPPLNDINVRKALSLAFNEEWVGKNLFHNAFKRINSFFPNSILASPNTPKNNNALPPLRTRLHQADTLLKQSGWIIEDGKRVNKETHEPMHFEILLSSVQEEKIALTYKRTLERLGITLDIRMADSATFQKRKNIYDYDILTHYWQNSLSPGTEQMLYWSCDAAEKTAGFNYSGICSKNIDSIATKIADAKTYDDLMSYTQELDQIGISNSIFIPFFYKGTDYIAHSKTLHYPKTTPIYGIVLESWWHE